jgi:DDE superfamily endonuclease
MAVEGSTTQKVFEAYVENVLAPTLKPGQVVILDNLGAHKGQKARELIESRAASASSSCLLTRQTSIRSKKPSRRLKRSSRRWQPVPARHSSRP